jgi:hypothetical protein
MDADLSVQFPDIPQALSFEGRSTLDSMAPVIVAVTFAVKCSIRASARIARERP